jgi:hypothetical protein
MASAAFTIPESAGFLSGSSVYTGFVEGFGGSTDEDQANFYVGATLNTPVTGFKVGGAFDYVANLGGVDGADARTYAVYASFAATEKLSLHVRAEYADIDDVYGGFSGVAPGVAGDIFALTGTIEYDLWRNVLSRLEVRWDHAASGGDLFAGDPGAPSLKNQYLIAANFIYKF